MIKYLFVFILIFPFYAHGAYLAKSKVGACQGVNHYSNVNSCEVIEGASCIEKIEGYNCEYHVLSGNSIVEDATKKAAYLLRLQQDADAAAAELTQRLARLQDLRNKLASLDGPLTVDQVKAILKHVVVEEIRRLKRELE